jgi:hypothetical protein
MAGAGTSSWSEGRFAADSVSAGLQRLPRGTLSCTVPRPLNTVWLEGFSGSQTPSAERSWGFDSPRPYELNSHIARGVVVVVGIFRGGRPPVTTAQNARRPVNQGIS